MSARFPDWEDPEQLRCPACDWRSEPYNAISGWYSTSIDFAAHLQAEHPEKDRADA